MIRFDAKFLLVDSEMLGTEGIFSFFLKQFRDSESSTLGGLME